MKTRDCCLTLLLPKLLEEAIVGHLLDHSEWVADFSTCDVSGHGTAGVVRSVEELVRGATRRVQVQIVMNRADAVALIETLRARLSSPEVVYWLTPVLELGRLA